MNKMQNKKKQKPNHGGNNKSHSRKWQESELRIWKVVSVVLQHSTTTRGSRPEIWDGTGEKRKRKRRGKTKLLLRQTSETMNLERLSKMKERKTTKMNKVENTPLEKRNKGYDENPEV